MNLTKQYEKMKAAVLSSENRKAMGARLTSAALSSMCPPLRQNRVMRDYMFRPRPLIPDRVIPFLAPALAVLMLLGAWLLELR